ncbi:MAG: sulfur oxidation c-type cytochrome SoxX [Paracoccaceae bacterium]
MKSAILSAVVLAASSSLALAADVVAPTNVNYGEYGAIDKSLTGVPGDPAAGRKVIGTKSLGNCVACHKISEMSDVPFHGEIGPSLDGAGSRWDEAQLRGIVADAKHTFPDTIMPSFYKVSGFIRPGDAFTGKAAEEPLPPLLSAQQIEDVVAYLMTLKEQ